MIYDPIRLLAFVKQSNAIENITRDPTEAELNAHVDFLKLEAPTIADLETFVSVCQPGKMLRSKTSMPGVRVGDYIAPPSGPSIVKALEALLEQVREDRLKPFDAHCQYETIHPFADCNGRSGRMLWLWHQKNRGNLPTALHYGFLRYFYYTALDAYQNAPTDRSPR